MLRSQAPPGEMMNNTGTGIRASRPQDDSTPHSAPVGAPAAPRSRLRTPQLLAAAGLIVVAAIIAGVVWYQRSAARPPQAVVSAFLEKSAAPLPVRVAGLDVTYGTPNATGCPVTYQARFETTEPLYRRIDATDYLRTHAATELAAIDAATALLRGPNGARIQAALATGEGPGTRDQGPGTDATRASRPQDAKTPQSATPASVARGPAFAPVLVTTQTPAGSTAAAAGTLLAWRREGTWGFTGSGVALDPRLLAGEPKPVGAFAVDNAADLARLTTLIAEQVAYAGKVQAAAAAVAADLERHRQEQIAAFAQQLRAGTLFTGSITDPIRGNTQRIVLEVTGTDTPRLTAVLRNDGGWTDARPFTGDWTVAAGAESATVTLRTGRADALDSAGPLLQDRLDWSIVLQLRPDGTVTVPTGADGSPLRAPLCAVPVTLKRVDPADAAGIKAEVLRPLTSAIAATRPGMVYRGTATSRVTRTSELVLLRFLAPSGSDVGRDLPIPPSAPGSNAAPVLPAPPSATGSDTARDVPIPPPFYPGDTLDLRATLESFTTPGRVRPFRGAIVSNTYRVGTAPIRLQSADSERVPQADSRSVVGFDSTNNSLAPALRVDGTGLAGEDRYFTYAFTPAPAGSNAGTPAANPEIPASPPGDAGAGTPAVQPLLTNALLATTTTLEPGIAYARIAGRWVPLPHNNGHEVKKLVQVLSGWLNKITPGGAKPAGEDVKSSDAIIGELVFDGTDPVPVLPGADALIVYVGGITPRSQKEVAAYPTLLLEPPIELAPMRRLDSGARYTLLSELVPGIKYFGPRRVDVAIDQPRPTLTVLRPRAALPPGPYAVQCSGQTFEFIAQ